MRRFPVFLVLGGAVWAVAAGGASSRSAAPTCPSTIYDTTKLVSSNDHPDQGNARLLECVYTEYIGLYLRYYPPSTPADELPARSGTAWCSGVFTSRSQYSSSVYAVAYFTGNAKEGNANPTTASGYVRSLAAQADGVAHSCAETDTTPPTVTVFAASGFQGRKFALKYVVRDPDDKQVKVHAEVRRGDTGARVASINTSTSTGAHAFTWTPEFRRVGAYEWCVSAQDAAGNKSALVCRALTIYRHKR